ncbi:hypothetical protein PPACK8108_LOCUS12986 [Phakopsora pachyrhizi]|uniref:Uncharacterized protein n=1 Tax=Phakopsora pachyrhizi TaxID=170000 RepID=A0AAV0B2H3_PHAPC|nr:hypothetical protein PPACK8108_LOCUS12986 [Phakopsora pachyrhizi]
MSSWSSWLLETIAELRHNPKEDHLNKKIDDELKKAKANATTNKRAATAARRQKNLYEQELDHLAVNATMGSIREQMDLTDKISNAILNPVGMGQELDEDEMCKEVWTKDKTGADDDDDENENGVYEAFLDKDQIKRLNVKFCTVYDLLTKVHQENSLKRLRRVARLFVLRGTMVVSKGSSYQAALLSEAFKSFQTKQPWDFERIHNSDHGLCKWEAEMTRLQKQFFEDDSPHRASLKKKRMTMTMAEVKNLGTWSNSVNSNNRSKTTTALARIAALLEGFGGDLKRLIGLGQTVIVIWKGPWRDLIKPEQPKSLSVGQNFEELQRMAVIEVMQSQGIELHTDRAHAGKETAGGEDDHEPEPRELQDRPQKE